MKHPSPDVPMMRPLATAAVRVQRRRRGKEQLSLAHKQASRTCGLVSLSPHLLRRAGLNNFQLLLDKAMLLSPLTSCDEKMQFGVGTAQQYGEADVKARRRYGQTQKADRAVARSNA